MTVSIYDGTQIGADGRRHQIGDVPTRAPRHGYGCSSHDEDELSVYAADEHPDEPDVEGDGD